MPKLWMQSWCVSIFHSSQPFDHSCYTLVSIIRVSPNKPTTSPQRSPTLWFSWWCVASPPFAYRPSFCSALSCWPISEPVQLSRLSAPCFSFSRELFRTLTDTPLCSSTSSISRLWQPAEFVQCSSSSGHFPCSWPLCPSGKTSCGMQALLLAFPSLFSSFLLPASRSSTVCELRTSNPKLPNKRSNRRETHWTWRGTEEQRSSWCWSSYFSWSVTSLPGVCSYSEQLLDGPPSTSVSINSVAH